MEILYLRRKMVSTPSYDQRNWQDFMLWIMTILIQPINMPIKMILLLFIRLYL